MNNTTSSVRSYWEQQACGTDGRVTSSDKLTRQYFQEIEDFRYTHEDFIHSFAQFSRARGKTVLEVGVGAATDFTQWVRSGARAHGVDLTQEGIEHAKARMQLEGLEAASLQRVNAEELPFEDEFFDVAFSWGVIHHADNMENCLAEIIRTTKRGGEIKIMLYNRRSLFSLTRLIRYGWMRGKFFKSLAWALYYHTESLGTKGYTPNEIKCIAQKFDCELVAIDFYEQKIRKGAQYESIRRWIRAMTPQRVLFYMAIKMRRKLED